MRSQAGIRHLALIRLVHQIYINRRFEDARWQIDSTHFLAFHIEDIYFHNCTTPTFT
jgi:hypothetical protein